MQMELFKSLSGTYITHIPYRGAGPALNDTVAGQVPIIFDNLPSALPFIKDGRLVPIVVAAPQRCRSCPTCRPSRSRARARQPDGLLRHPRPQGPAGDVVDKVSAAVKKTLDDPSVKKRIEDTGSIIIANTPEQFAAQIAAEFDVWQEGRRAAEADAGVSPRAR